MLELIPGVPTLGMLGRFRSPFLFYLLSLTTRAYESISHERHSPCESGAY